MHAVVGIPMSKESRGGTDYQNTATRAGAREQDPVCPQEEGGRAEQAQAPQQ